MAISDEVKEAILRNDTEDLERARWKDDSFNVEDAFKYALDKGRLKIFDAITAMTQDEGSQQRMKNMAVDCVFKKSVIIEDFKILNKLICRESSESGIHRMLSGCGSNIAESEKVTFFLEIILNESILGSEALADLDDEVKGFRSFKNALLRRFFEQTSDVSHEYLVNDIIADLLQGEFELIPKSRENSPASLEDNSEGKNQELTYNSLMPSKRHQAMPAMKISGLEEWQQEVVREEVDSNFFLSSSIVSARAERVMKNSRNHDLERDSSKIR